MANPIVKINDVRVVRASIVKWWLSGDTVTVIDCLGEQHVKTYDTASSATAALAVMDNLTEIDDIDGL